MYAESMLKGAVMQKQEMITNIITLFPAMMKKIRWYANFTEMPKQQLMLLHAISRHENMPMSFYSDRLIISKPNLTVLADKLIEAGHIERNAAPDDRRLIVLNITPRGRDYMGRVWNEMTESLMKKFERIDDKTLSRLNDIVVEMDEIISKIDKLPED